MERKNTSEKIKGHYTVTEIIMLPFNIPMYIQNFSYFSFR